jgi:hypothetical protein
MAERFAQVDKNGDGKLTRDEFPAAKIFDSADTDHDGLLTPEELAAYFRKQPSTTPATPSEPRPQPAPGPVPAPVPKVDIVATLNVPYAAIEGVNPDLMSPIGRRGTNRRRAICRSSFAGTAFSSSA